MQITQRNPVDNARPEFCAGRKVSETHKALLWHLLNDDPTCPSSMVLHAIAEEQVQISSNRSAKSEYTFLRLRVSEM